MCTWRGSLWPKHPGSYFRHHLSRRHLLADGSGGWSPLAPVHHCTCDTNQCFVAYFIHIQSLKKKCWKEIFPTVIEACYWKQTFHKNFRTMIIEFWNPVRQVNSLMISLYLFSYTNCIKKVFLSKSMFYSKSILVLWLFENKHNYLSMKLFKRSKQGAFLGGQGLSVHSSSSVRESLLECPSPCLRPYLGV